MTSKFRQAVEKAVKENFPKENHSFETISEEAWKEYEQLINMYRKGESVDCGWYKLILGSMINCHVEERLAHCLSYSRLDLL